jgi:hypothetical protein
MQEPVTVPAAPWKMSSSDIACLRPWDLPAFSAAILAERVAIFAHLLFVALVHPGPPFVEG